MGKWGETDIPDLTGRRALVTGAASGIGFETARALALHGARVIIADRNAEAGHTALDRIRALRPDARVEFQALDLADLGKVKAFAASILAQGDPLDLQINNAGIQPISTRLTSADGFELTFAIGHLGHFALTAYLYPLVAAATAGRIVTVSSLVHGSGRFDWDDLNMTKDYNSQRAYNQTKLANLLFARELQARIDQRGDRVKSLAAHPGVAQTSIGANRKSLGAFHLVDHLVSLTLSLVMPFLGQPAAEGALPILYAATSNDVVGGGFYGPDGWGEMKGFPSPAKVKPAARDPQVASRLWAVTEQLTGTRFF